MAIEETPNLGLKTYTAGTDPHPTRGEHNAERQLLDAILTRASQGPLVNRPTAGKARRFYLSTDVPKRLYMDDGTEWVEISANGGGGAGAALNIGGAGSEGTATRSARADHVHPLPLATSAVPGAMSAADKAKLDNATSSSTASRMVIRDAGGRAQFATPSAGPDAATKQYVDDTVGNAASATHTHPATAIVSGTLDPARLPLATGTTAGALSAADKAELDAATVLATPGTIMFRDPGGRTNVADPVIGADAANKAYVDNQVGTRAATTHNHSWSQITSGVPATFPPSAHTHAAADTISGVFDPARIPLATGSSAGGISSANFNRLDLATFNATPNRLALRDIDGRARFADPVDGLDAANRSYVDSGLSTKAATTHQHDGGDITTGVIPSGRLPVVNASFNGAMTPAYKALLDSVDVNASGSSLVKRDISGRVTVIRPTAAAHAADKDYVDDMIATRAPSSHTHGGSDIISNVPESRITGSDIAWTRTSPTTSTWATVTVDSNGAFSRYSSSLRTKENIASLDPKAELERLLKVRPVRYDRIGRNTPNDELGMIVEETHGIYPEVSVIDPENGPDGIHYEMLVAPIIAAFQEHHRLLMETRAALGLDS